MSNTVAITLVKALNELVAKYNAHHIGVNFVDIRNFQNYIEQQGVDIVEINKLINKK